ncbi:hypothetical protein V5O48_007972 [Marasmius crinis-equi]|uniref:Carboxylic ester hydrolase n=1 Tax=Marasmius crinis-equi TaxID=585013 RepID=A0ABR3FFK5_9AGAR
MFLGFLALVAQAALALALTTVQLDSATVTGTSSGRISKFFGIPFAKSPTGVRRFRLPEPNDPYNTSFNAFSMGPSCPQQALRLPIRTGLDLVDETVNAVVNDVYGIAFPDSEDCLTINVITPANAAPDSKLPIVAWIFGGVYAYDGTSIVERSIELGQPVIYVSMNYRLSGFGFLASKEVKEAGVGNLGLQDQREALRWIQKYIGAFGGDPTKVTIWGESAGAISVALHMLADGGDTEGLYRAAFMQSGSPIPVGDITNGQICASSAVLSSSAEVLNGFNADYDSVVRDSGCSESTDTLACLRTVPYSTLKAAIDATPNFFDYQSLRLAWLPRADGVFLTDAPMELVRQGRVANIPIVSGDCDDEGTLFSFSTLNVTTEDEVRTYVKTVFFPEITDQELDNLMRLYPQDPAQGSPYDTGYLNFITPQFKRFASVQGDAVFQGPRRFFLENLSGKQNIWSFLSKRAKLTPFLGSFHSSDIFNVYGRGKLTDYLIRFATTLDPNGSGTPEWPKYTTESPQLLTFVDDLLAPTRITQDTYRKEPMGALIGIILKHPI